MCFLLYFVLSKVWNSKTEKGREYARENGLSNQIQVCTDLDYYHATANWTDYLFKFVLIIKHFHSASTNSFRARKQTGNKSLCQSVHPSVGGVKCYKEFRNLWHGVCPYNFFARAKLVSVQPFKEQFSTFLSI